MKCFNCGKDLKNGCIETQCYGGVLVNKFNRKFCNLGCINTLM